MQSTGDSVAVGETDVAKVDQVNYPTDKPWIFYCSVIDVIDGDTFDAVVDLGFRVYAKIRFRLARVNIPARWHPDWTRAKNRLAELILGDEMLKIVTKINKYGHWVAEIEDVCDEMSKEWPIRKVEK